MFELIEQAEKDYEKRIEKAHAEAHKILVENENRIKQETERIISEAQAEAEKMLKEKVPELQHETAQRFEKMVEEIERKAKAAREKIESVSDWVLERILKYGSK